MKSNNNSNKNTRKASNKSKRDSNKKRKLIHGISCTDNCSRNINPSNTKRINHSIKTNNNKTNNIKTNNDNKTSLTILACLACL